MTLSTAAPERATLEQRTAPDSQTSACLTASNRISIITPTTLDPDRIEHIQELHRSILAAAQGLDVEWVIVVDGVHKRRVPAEIREDPQVTIVRPRRQVGAASARNLGLARATGQYVASCDDDDLLPVTSLRLRLQAIDGVAWVGGQLADLHPDGTTSTWVCPTAAGEVGPGGLWHLWGAPEAVFPLGPTTLLIRTALLRAVGGWQALPQAEDFGMVMAVTSLTAGRMLDDVVYLYRKHQGQMMAGAGFNQLEPEMRRICFERGRLLTQSLGFARA